MTWIWGKVLKRCCIINHPEMKSKNRRFMKKQNPTEIRPPCSRVDAHTNFELKCLHQDRNKLIILSSFGLTKEFNAQGRKVFTTWSFKVHYDILGAQLPSRSGAQLPSGSGAQLPSSLPWPKKWEVEQWVDWAKPKRRVNA